MNITYFKCPCLSRARNHWLASCLFQRDFEAKKRLSGGGDGGGSGVVLELPPGLTETHRQRCRATMEEAVGKSRHAGDIKITGSRMLLNGELHWMLQMKSKNTQAQNVYTRAVH